MAQFESKPHTYGEPVWNWSDDHSSAKATFTYTDCERQETVNATVTKTESTDKIIYTVTVEFGGKTYTDTYEHPHVYGEPTWNWSDDYSKAKATFTCTDCEYTETVDATVTRIEKDGQITYTAVAEFNSKTCIGTVY